MRLDGAWGSAWREPQPRFQIRHGGVQSHLRTLVTVVDTHCDGESTVNRLMSGNDIVICECFELKSAELIINALNHWGDHS